MEKEIVINVDHLSDVARKFLEDFPSQIAGFCNPSNGEAIAFIVNVLFAAEQANLNFGGASYLTSIPIKRTPHGRLVLGEEMATASLAHFIERVKTERGIEN